MRKHMLVIMLVLAVTAGCDRIADSSQAVQSVTYKTFTDARSSWEDFFTYHPPLPAPAPQTRYCYQMQSDVVCYDSHQPQLTSKLIGYQNDDAISWVQPGGGSLGASGGEPVALRPVAPQTSLNETPPINDFMPGLNFDRTAAPASPIAAAPTKGAVDVKNLPPINSTAKVGQKI